MTNTITKMLRSGTLLFEQFPDSTCVLYVEEDEGDLRVIKVFDEGELKELYNGLHELVSNTNEETGINPAIGGNEENGQECGTQDSD